MGERRALRAEGRIMGDRPRVIIAGGGIGGLCAAIALRRLGIPARIVERSASADHMEVGAGLHLWTNAVQALARLDLHEAVVQRGTPMRRQRYLDHRGRQIGALDVAGISRRLGAETVGITRPVLHRLLLDTLLDLDTDALLLDAVATAVTEREDEVVLHLAGGEEVRGDVLVGADGMTSLVRAHLHGRQPPTYSGYTAWRALCDVDHPEVPVGEMWLYWGRGARLLHYHVSDGRVYWLAMATAPAGGRDAPGRRKEDLLERYRDFAEPVRALLAGTDEEAILRQDVVDRDPLDTWGRGRITLLGDAAHPMSPNMAQGAGQAIEDAVALARCLGYGGDPATALRRYETARIGRTNELVRVSRTIGRLGRLAAPVAAGVRNRLVLPAVYASYPRFKAEQDLTPVL
jgi:2-polyprenyl-6-methoxyphenol hydroxylase-like FAD-dependent oxidoreductase